MRESLLVAVTLLAMAAGCTASEPAAVPPTNEAQLRAELNKLAKRYKVPSIIFQLNGKDVVIGGEGASEVTYDRMHCVMDGIRSLGIPAIGFIGNEAYADDPHPSSPVQ